MANNKDENVKEKVEEAQKATKEAAKLAANAASGNVIGAAKNAMNLLKNKKTKRAMIMSLIQPIVMILVILLLAASLFGVFNAIKDTLIGFIGDVGSGISEVWKWLTDDYWINLDEIVETDPETGEEYTLVDKYIKDLDATGISLVELGILGEADYAKNENPFDNPETKAKVEKYIAEFIRADIITQQPHKRSGSELVDKDNQNKVDGSIYLFRTKEDPAIDDEHFVDGEYKPPEVNVSDTEYKQMTYVDYEEFTEMIANYNPEITSIDTIRYKFSIDPDTEELVLAEITEKTVIDAAITEPKIGEWFVDVDTWLSLYDVPEKAKYTITEKRIPYKEYIAKYTMPYEFLINLCQVTKNPEFVYHVALLARESEIILGVQDNITVDRIITEVETDNEYFENTDSNSSAGAGTDEITQTKRRTVEITTTQTPVLRVEYADTWSFYEEFEYSAMLEGKSEESEVTTEKPTIPETLEHYEEATDAMYDSFTRITCSRGNACLLV